MEIKNDSDVSLADALIRLSKASSEGTDVPALKQSLAAVLDLTNPGWREDEVVVNWVKGRPLVEAANSLLNRHLK